MTVEHTIDRSDIRAGVHAPAEEVEPFVPAGGLVEPGVAGPLSVEALLVFADTHAPAVAVARSRLGLARADRIEADIPVPQNPTLGVGIGGRTSAGRTGLEFELSVSQRLELAGEPALRRRAADATARLAQATVAETRWAVHVTVHRQIFELLAVREQIAQAKEAVSFSKSLRRIAVQQIQAGESSPLILLVADADLAVARERLLATQQIERVGRARLATVSGWPLDKPLEVDGKLPAPKTVPDLEALLGLMSARHPSLRTRELAVEAARARVALADGEANVTPTFGVAYGREAAPVEGDAAHIWLVNVSVPLPFWRQNQGERARAEARLLIADRERAANAARLRGALLQARTAVESSAERLHLYETGAVSALKKNLGLLEKAFALGEVDIHQVSQTRQRMFESVSRYLAARVTYFQNLAVLEGLVGTELWPAP